jgi:two-component system sensor histidine kinase EvgS
MIVEDEEGARKAVARILESLGYDVAEAESGDEALAIIKGGREIDIVITDLSLLGMSGWELSKAILAYNTGIKVAILSGWDIEDDDERIAESGVTEILSKPIDMHRMKDAIARMMS